MTEKVEQQAERSAVASSFSRISLVIYLLLIMYASWYPFAGWRDLGLSAFAYLKAPLPHYWTVFDVWTNVAGYLPFGMLVVLALPRSRRWSVYWAILPATLAGILFSGTMEAVQTFLPTRVASNLDLMTNSAGALLGAVLGAFLRPRFGPDSRLLQLREQWFNREASQGMVVVALWPLAQIYPLSHLFGFGQFTSMLSTWLSDLLEQPVDLQGWITNDVQFTAAQYWLTETIITACGLTGAALTFLILLRKQAPKVQLTLLLIFITLMTKALATALLFAPDNAFVWLTPGSFGGLLIGGLMLGGLAFAPQLAQRRLAGLCLVITLLLVNIMPDNPYYVETQQTWTQGKFLNFNGVAQFLALLWPFCTLWFLFHPLHRRRAASKNSPQDSR
ncbi:vanZ like family protein [Collimonas arenae]|uniref:VanZ like family protein n=1 Tax=Collimonas arenae TaxID=279058 RepID=A0A127PWR7_9BURK|nr:VanZ family protein [Collimonas arenae]AMP02189.1 vanZ like family protein [Collimonas arenae]AMP12086.1 vanZ like family protein [Collimonas arenae]